MHGLGRGDRRATLIYPLLRGPGREGQPFDSVRGLRGTQPSERRGPPQLERLGADLLDLAPLSAIVGVAERHHLILGRPDADRDDRMGHPAGDWFRFEIAAAAPVADGAVGVRLPVTTYVGTASWAKFHVDLVGPDVTMTGQPDDVPALARVVMPDGRHRPRDTGI